jgi:hydroxyacylglutathione hydrolase
VLPIVLGQTRVFLLLGERPVLVDTGNPGQGPTVVTRLAEHGVDPRDLGLIIITHAHRDHTGSLHFLKEASGAPVLAHRLDADPISQGRDSPLGADSCMGRLLKLLLPEGSASSEGVLEPDIVLDEDPFDLTPYGVCGRILHTPGHTPGSLSLLMDSGEAIVGDLVMGALLAFGPPAIAFFAWSKEESRESIRRVLATEPRIILSTHAGPFDPHAVRRRLLPSGRS